jgi:hypothetical protein
VNEVTPDQAQAALNAIGRARQTVAGEVGLPRGYWWVMAVAWVVLGALGTVGSPWLVTSATIVFGVAHSVFATRLLDGRRRTARLQVSRATAGRRVAVAVVGMLVVLVVLTIGAALALNADGAGHPQIWSAVFVAAVIGFGGPGMLHQIHRSIEA